MRGAWDTDRIFTVQSHQGLTLPAGIEFRRDARLDTARYWTLHIRIDKNADVKTVADLVWATGLPSLTGFYLGGDREADGTQNLHVYLQSGDYLSELQEQVEFIVEKIAIRDVALTPAMDWSVGAEVRRSDSDD